jgi:hypothetical protein
MTLSLWSNGSVGYSELKSLPPSELEVIMKSVKEYREQMAKLEAARFGGGSNTLT